MPLLQLPFSPKYHFLFYRSILFIASNFALLTHLSSRLLLTNLRRELERCVTSDSTIESWLTESTPSTQLLEITAEIIAARFNEEAVNILCKQLAKKDQKEFDELIQKLPQEYRAIIEPKVQGYVSSLFFIFSFFY